MSLMNWLSQVMAVTATAIRTIPQRRGASSEAEKRFKQAGSIEEKVAALEEMMATIPRHKGTEKLQAELKSRDEQIAELKATVDALVAKQAAATKAPTKT